MFVCETRTPQPLCWEKSILRIKKSSAEQAQQQAQSHQYATALIDACREQLDKEVNAMRRCEQEMLQREHAVFLLQQHQQHQQQAAASRNTRSHEQMNDLGNVDMVDEASDDTVSRGARSNFYHGRVSKIYNI